MKTKLLHTLIASAALLAPTFAQAFEGKINLHITNPERSADPRNVTLCVKGELLRTDFTPPAGPRGREIGPMATIIDHSKHEVTVLMPERKSYFVNLMPRKVAGKVAGNFAQTEFKATGRKEAIAGVEALEYTGTSENGKFTELWVTKEMGKFLVDNPGMGETQYTGSQTTQAAWTRFAYDNDFFVLRAVERTEKGGTEKFRLEVTKIDRTSQPDSLFKIPEGFKKIEPGRGMMGGE